METLYFNHAGTTWPKPRVVQQAVQNLSISDSLDWSSQFQVWRDAIASFFRVEPANLLLTPSCTTALSLAISEFEWNTGDRLLISGLEHHALHAPAYRLVRMGVDLEVLPSLPGDPVVLQELEACLKKGNVKLVAVSAASNVTGEILPIEAIIDLAHQHGAKVLVDAAQTAGWGWHDLAALGADMFAFAGHKGPHAIWGIGGLYIAPEVCMSSLPASCEVPVGNSGGAVCSTKPGFCDAGSVNLFAMASLAAAVEWLETPENQHRLENAQSMADQVYQVLDARPSCTVYGSADPKLRMPTVAFTSETFSPSELAARLRAKGVIVSGGLQCAPLAHRTIGTAPNGVVRISLGPGNSEADVEQLVQTIEDLEP